MSKIKSLNYFVVILLVVGYLYFGITYIKYTRKQDELTLRLDNISRTLSLIPSASVDVEQRLSQAQQEYQTLIQTTLPDKVNTTQTIGNILDITKTYNINIVSVTTSPWVARTIDRENYRSLTIILNAESSPDNLQEFIRHLDSNEFPFLRIDGVNISGYNTNPKEPMVNSMLELALITRQPQTKG